MEAHGRSRPANVGRSLKSLGMSEGEAKDDRIDSCSVLLMRSTIPYSSELERLVSRRRRSQIFGSTLMRRLKSDHSSEVSAIVCQVAVN